jgi:type II secretory pathway pseudopilin PulG
LKSVKLVNEKMTLVELIVVLSIIVAIASVAIVSMDGINDNSRYSETKRRGGLVKQIIDGDSTFAAGAFVSDMGRLPYVINPLKQALLAEVYYSEDLINIFDSSMLYRTSEYSNSTNDWGGVLSAGAFSFPSSLLPVKLDCGWRGPYLNVSKNSFYDGWGNPWSVKISSDNSWIGTFSETDTPSFQKTIFGIISLGKNNLKDSAPTDWTNRDLQFNFDKNRMTSMLNIQIYYPDTSVSPKVFRPLDSAFMDHIRVALFAPYVTHDGTASDNVKRILAVNNAGTKNITITPAADVSYPHYENKTPALWEGVHGVTLYNLSPGCRKIFVYGFKSSTASNKFGSSLLTINLHPGMNVLNVYLSEGL